MEVIAKYSHATTSSNLKDDATHSNTEILAAAALASKIGTKLFRVKYSNDATSYVALLTDWIDIVSAKAFIRNWPKDISPRKVARLSLDYWLCDVCHACTGKALETVTDVPNVLSDNTCKTCNGTGKRPLHVKHSLMKYVGAMVESLEGLVINARNETAKKMAPERIES